MLVKRKWIVCQKGFGLRSKPGYDLQYAKFEGLFLFGFIPLWIKQIDYWD